MPLVISPVAPRIDHSLDEPATIRWFDPRSLTANALSLSVYGDPSEHLEDLMESIRTHGILVPLVVTAGSERGTWEILSGHRRWACALAMELDDVPCEVRVIDLEVSRRRL